MRIFEGFATVKHKAAQDYWVQIGSKGNLLNRTTSLEEARKYALEKSYLTRCRNKVIRVVSGPHKVPIAKYKNGRDLGNVKRSIKTCSMKGCGQKFEMIPRGRPRLYCDDCGVRRKSRRRRL